MKGFTVTLLCALVAVQGRSAGLQRVNDGTVAALGENPWIVHLRVATVFGGGFLSSCAGSLIDNSWVLTSASCLQDSTFNWVRYGVVNVPNPEVVTESNVIRRHPDWNPETGENNLALISINRVVESSANIQPISISGDVPSNGRICGWGATEDDTAGEQLRCVDVALEGSGDRIIADASATRFDLGVPLVSEGVQVGVLVDPSGEFISLANYLDWISEETGLSFNAARVPTSDRVMVVDP